MQFSLKYYKPGVLIPTVLILSIIIDLLITFVICQFPKIEVLRVPSNSALIALFFTLHNRYLWHLKFFNLLVKVPDIRGRYTGKINYNWGGKDASKECKIEVTQTASSISINSYFNNEDDEKTSSKSLVEDIREEDGFFHLYLFYLNSGTVEDDNLDCHEGANRFKFLPESENREAKLIGNYFTNRQIQTRGSIEVKFESKTLNGEF